MNVWFAIIRKQGQDEKEINTSVNDSCLWVVGYGRFWLFFFIPASIFYNKKTQMILVKRKYCESGLQRDYKQGEEKDQVLILCCPLIPGNRHQRVKS